MRTDTSMSHEDESDAETTHVMRQWNVERCIVKKNYSPDHDNTSQMVGNRVLTCLQRRSDDLSNILSLRVIVFIELD
jgi:hypothetical protein